MIKKSSRSPKPDTMADTGLDQIEIEVANLRLLNNLELASVLEGLLKAASQNLTRIAGCIRVHEERGMKLPPIHDNLLSNLRLIGQGSLSAEAYVAFGSKPMLMKAIRNLPKADQDEIARTGTIDVVRYNGISTKPHKTRVDTLKRGEIAQVFDGPRIRNTDEQIAIAHRKTDPTNTADQAFVTVTMSVAEKMKFMKKAAEAGLSAAELGRNAFRELDLI